MGFEREGGRGNTCFPVWGDRVIIRGLEGGNPIERNLSFIEGEQFNPSSPTSAKIQVLQKENRHIENQRGGFLNGR